MFIEGYHREGHVEAVKIIFITLPEFPYEALQDYMNKSEKITNSLNHIFTNINMDCGSCGFKNVCDEVEGLRELHFSKERLE